MRRTKRIPIPSNSVWCVHGSNLSNLAGPLDDGVSGADFPVWNYAMPQKLLDAILLRSCSHEFSWPRRAPDGQYYQVCLLCAAEYKYDWETMRRTDRMAQTASEGSIPNEKKSYKSSWMPRARRLKFVAPLRYRVRNLGNWSDGTIENLSQSGLFFHGAAQLPSNTLVEMIFEMPEEISGQKNSNVLCHGRVIRSRPAADCPDVVELAVTILDYKFIRQTSPAPELHPD